jgi:Copper binding proteins, plastocyanin/azurin family
MLAVEGSQALLWKPWTADLGALLGHCQKRPGPCDGQALTDVENARKEQDMIRFSLVAAGLLMAALVLTGPVSGAPKVVKGSVGPGFTISLTSGGKKVTSLKAGVPYKFQISDRSSSHDFHLSGPGVNKVITSVSFTGMKSVTLKLKRGTYRYVCDPHSSVMRGSFRVR